MVFLLYFLTFKVNCVFVCSTLNRFDTKKVGCPHIRFLKASPNAYKHIHGWQPIYYELLRASCLHSF